MNSLCVAIHPDDYSPSPDKYNASSPRWAEEIQRAGHRVRWVDVRKADILQQLSGCQGFMWRWAHSQGMGRIARRLLPVIERELNLTVFPDQSTCWHYDDKIAQAYLLRVAGIPTPETWIWFDRDAALSWADAAAYPMVLKLATGAGATNVALVRSAAAARKWIKRLFKKRVTSLDDGVLGFPALKQRARKTAGALLRGTSPLYRDDGFEPQSGYALFQEFLEGNPFDTRVTVIGNRAFAFRRFNRPNDFRASGSGSLAFEPSEIDLQMVRLGFDVAKRLEAQSCAIDGLYRAGKPVVGEVSYTYASWAVHDCPGHWELEGNPPVGKLIWREGHMWPEEAQVADFLVRLESTWLPTPRATARLQ
jgi:hypothetical protein